MINSSEEQTEPSRLGITLERQSTLSLNWADFAGGVADAATQFLLKGPSDGVSAGISALAKLVGSARIEKSPGELAWMLTILSFAWALDQIKFEGELPRDKIRSALKTAIRSAKDKTETDSLVVPISFLERPTTIPLYRILRESVLSDRESFLVDRSEAPASLSFRIDAAYMRAVYEIWLKQPEVYQDLANASHSPITKSAEFTLGWQAYRQRLINDFKVRPVFGQEEKKISLSQLYVPLRAYWSKDPKNKEDLEYSGNLPKGNEIALLDEALDDWVVNAPEPDWLRLVGGGPGSGKSTTLKRLARYFAERSDWRPLFIPIQYIDLEIDLREAINRYFTHESDGPFSQPPLSRASVEDGPPLLLIFDGLDEISAPNEAAKEVIATFSNRLNTLVASLKGGKSQHLRVVVSGRMPAFQNARRFLPTVTGGALETYGFLPANSTNEDVDPLWLIDQRPRLWKQYAALTGEQQELPQAFSSARLAGITQEPLLCYLLALAGYATNRWE